MPSENKSQNGTEYKLRAYETEGDAMSIADTREPTETAALQQKAYWEREGAHVTMEEVSAGKEAHEEDECLLCAPAPHRNCEMYTVVQMLAPLNVPLGEDDEDHLVSIPVCLEHFQAFQKYQRGNDVAEVTNRV